MSDESKEAVSTPDTSKDEKDENKDTEDTSMEQDDADTSQEKDDSVDKSDDEESKKEKGENNDEENDDDEEESDDEPQVGSLEKPLVLEEGKKRERKKVERMSFQSGEKTHEGLEIKGGKGRSLGDIPYIEHMLARTKAEDVKPLHRLLYRRPGSNHDVKKNIRQFSGFPFTKDDAEYEKRLQILKGKSFTMPMIKRIMDILDIPRSGVKEELVARLMEWLEKPKDSGRKIPQPKRKRKSKGSAGKKEKGTKEKKKEKKKKKETKTKAVADDDEDDDEDMDDQDEDKEEKASDDDENEDGGKDEGSDQASEPSDEEEEEPEPPKKKAKKATPKPKEKKPKQKATPKAKPSKTPTKKKATPKKKAKVSNEEVSDVSSDSDDEPLVKKEKSKSAPTNDELKDVVKKMLDNANLEQVTMKTVLKDVFAKYPEFDLTDRKDFIKNTVKQIIS